MHTYLFALLSLSLVASVHANEPPTLMPPVARASEGQAPAPVAEPPVSPAPAVVEPPQPAYETAPRPRTYAKPPPARIEAASGQNTIFGISQGHLNRIITPFTSPTLKTTSTATLSVEKNIVYVSTASSEPVGLYIHDGTDPVHALSVTLVPSDIPPVSVEMRLKGYAPETQVAPQPGDAERARGWETEQPYIQALTTAFKDLALGKIPDGYALETVSGWPLWASRCEPGGFSVSPRQVVIGFNMGFVVAVATNRSGRYLEVPFDDGRCAGLDVLGAAAWPSETVAPGDAVELYVAYRKIDETPSDMVRPSLIGARARR